MSSSPGDFIETVRLLFEPFRGRLVHSLGSLGQLFRLALDIRPGRKLVQLAFLSWKIKVSSDDANALCFLGRSVGYVAPGVTSKTPFQQALNQSLLVGIVRVCYIPRYHGIVSFISGSKPSPDQRQRSSTSLTSALLTAARRRIRRIEVRHRRHFSRRSGETHREHTIH